MKHSQVEKMTAKHTSAPMPHLKHFVSFWMTSNVDFAGCIEHFELTFPAFLLSSSPAFHSRTFAATAETCASDVVSVVNSIADCFLVLRPVG